MRWTPLSRTLAENVCNFTCAYLSYLFGFQSFLNGDAFNFISLGKMFL